MAAPVCYVLFGGADARSKLPDIQLLECYVYRIVIYHREHLLRPGTCPVATVASETSYPRTYLVDASRRLVLFRIVRHRALFRTPVNQQVDTI